MNIGIVLVLVVVALVFFVVSYAVVGLVPSLCVLVGICAAGLLALCFRPKGGKVDG